jgi:hypothetical protein
VYQYLLVFQRLRVQGQASKFVIVSAIWAHNHGLSTPSRGEKYIFWKFWVKGKRAKSGFGYRIQVAHNLTEIAVCWIDKLAGYRG